MPARILKYSRIFGIYFNDLGGSKGMSAEGLTRSEILNGVGKRLRIGSFNHWVLYRAGIRPIKKELINGNAKYLYPLDSIERIKNAMVSSDKQ